MHQNDGFIRRNDRLWTAFDKNSFQFVYFHWKKSSTQMIYAPNCHGYESMSERLFRINDSNWIIDTINSFILRFHSVSLQSLINNNQPFFHLYSIYGRKWKVNELDAQFFEMGRTEHSKHSTIIIVQFHNISIENIHYALCNLHPAIVHSMHGIDSCALLWIPFVCIVHCRALHIAHCM